ncbi:MAG: histidine phosphatase family protein [Chloroflexota bacterium]
MTKLILIRHAETEGNLNGVWNGVTDAPLTQRGQKQITATAHHMKSLVMTYPIHAFYASPIGRARKTAAAIESAIHRSAIVEGDLREFDLGDWEGRSMKELAEQENLWQRWAADPTFKPPNGESPSSFRARALKVIERLVARHTEETVLVVSHGGIIGNALGQRLDGSANDWAKWEPHNCSISLLEYDGEQWNGILVNDVGHLTPELIAEPNHDYANLE